MFELKKNLKIFFAAYLMLAIFLITSRPVSASSEDISQRFLIKFKPGIQMSDFFRVAYDIEKLFDFSARQDFKNIFSFKSSLSFSQLLADLNGQYEFLQNFNTLQIQDISINDPGFTVNEQNIDKQWALAKVGFDKSWTRTVGSRNNIIAVIDSGIDQTHEDLGNIKFVEGYDFVNNRSIFVNSNSDDNGHGTLIAGILGATPNNNKGIVGTNWNVSIMPIKAVDSVGKGDSGTISEAIVWAADKGANIINLSIGGFGFGNDTTLSNAIAYAFKKNIVIVAAAGNDTVAEGKNLDVEPFYPICDDNDANMVIGVTALDYNDLKPTFANYGKNCIDVSAPGKRILSTISIDPVTKKTTPNSYAFASGSSLAVPFVSGQAALIKSLYPSVSNVQIRSLIISTSDSVDEYNFMHCAGSCQGSLGSGRINVRKSLEKPINTQAFEEEDLIVIKSSGEKYQILGGQKRKISDFVYRQKFSLEIFKEVEDVKVLQDFPSGPYVMPNEETLIKLEQSPAVYFIRKGEKLPVSDKIFRQRNLKYENIHNVSFSEFNSWPTGSFLPPAEGTLVKTAKDPTLFWVAGQSLHPVNYNYYISRGLSIFPIILVSLEDFKSFPKGEPYLVF